MEKVEFTLEDVKAFLEANKESDEVKSFITSISVEKPINIESVKGYLENTSEGKDLLQRYNDSFFSRAVITHDEKNKPKIDALIAAKVNEKLAELNKDDTPEQKAIKEQARQIAEMNEKWENERKVSKINEIAYKEGIDPSFVEGINFASVEQFQLYSTKFKDYLKKQNEKVINEYVASNSFKPGGKKDEEKINLSNLSDKEILALEMSGELDKLIKP